MSTKDDRPRAFKTNIMSNHVLEVKEWIKSSNRVRSILSSDGSEIVKQACESISLRELGRRTGLSSTYLSQIKTKKIVISPEAFLKVHEVISTL